MNEPAYGTLKKKIVFYDSDKRYADLKIRLEYDYRKPNSSEAY